MGQTWLACEAQLSFQVLVWQPSTGRRVTAARRAHLAGQDSRTWRAQLSSEATTTTDKHRQPTATTTDIRLIGSEHLVTLRRTSSPVPRLDFPLSTDNNNKTTGRNNNQVRAPLPATGRRRRAARLVD